MTLHERQSSFISSSRIFDKGISTSKIGFEDPLDIVSILQGLARRWNITEEEKAPRTFKNLT